uniref:Uncharacterized protein n=1 Tax=Globisporangium ultimum (strain ATCC 200006 / CBS 805.95 / DAOM BR144) TaxID=431595 RepID=K3XAE8_GLOUD
MAKKSTSASKKSKGDSKAAAAAQKQDAAPVAGEDAELPLVLRIAIIGATSYVAEKIWTNRKVVSEVWYSGDQTMTQSTMITVFEYLGAMGMLFVVGIAVGLAMTKAAAYLPKF